MKPKKKPLTTQDKKVLRAIRGWKPGKISHISALHHDASSSDPTAENIAKKVRLPKKKTQTTIQKLKKRGLVSKEKDSSLTGYVWYSWYPTKKR